MIGGGSGRVLGPGRLGEALQVEGIADRVAYTRPFMYIIPGFRVGVEVVVVGRWGDPRSREELGHGRGVDEL